MGHHHGKGKKLWITIVLNMFITIIQYIGGILSGSLSLISDATHNLSDVIALLISWLAEKISQKQYTKKQTYGFKRAEVVAALINVVTIVVIAINIFIEGISRFSEIDVVSSSTIILLALLSIVVNGISVLIIKKDAAHSLNIRSAYLHLFSDMLTSVAVLVAGVMIFLFKWYWIDGLISMIIAVYLTFTSVRLLLETLSVLMQFTPKHLDLDEIKHIIESLDVVDNIHHVHAWQLTDDDIHFSGHIAFAKDLKLSDIQVHIMQIKEMLHEDFGINHCTFESEYQTHKASFVLKEH